MTILAKYLSGFELIYLAKALQCRFLKAQPTYDLAFVKNKSVRDRLYTIFWRKYVCQFSHKDMCSYKANGCSKLEEMRMAAVIVDVVEALEKRRFRKPGMIICVHCCEQAYNTDSISAYIGFQLQTCLTCTMKTFMWSATAIVQNMPGISRSIIHNEQKFTEIRVTKDNAVAMAIEALHRRQTDPTFFGVRFVLHGIRGYYLREDIRNCAFQMSTPVHITIPKQLRGDLKFLSHLQQFEATVGDYGVQVNREYRINKYKNTKKRKLEAIVQFDPQPTPVVLGNHNPQASNGLRDLKKFKEEMDARVGNKK
jgi:hypothetical protein